MPNITVNDIVSALGAPGNFIATTMSTNFQNILNTMNSNGLDSVNYGTSSFESRHISHEQIISQHFSNNAIVSAKLSDSAIIHPHINFASSDNGVRALQIGQLGDNIRACRFSQTYAFAGAATVSARAEFTNAIDGSPAYTATPVIAGEAQVQHTNTVNQFNEYRLTQLNSGTADFIIANSAGAPAAETVTLHLRAWGI